MSSNTDTVNRTSHTNTNTGAGTGSGVGSAGSSLMLVNHQSRLRQFHVLSCKSGGGER